MVELSIILVNYNTVMDTLRCIESIYAQTTRTTFEILVVDNASNDNSCAHITSKFPEVIWIQNHSNEGFGRANNTGIERSKGKYVLLLNTDTLVLNNSIDHALDYFKKEDVRVGMATCQLLNRDGTHQKSIFYQNASFKEIIANNLLYDFLTRKHKKQEQKDIKALHGAFLLFDKNKLETIGFFDPDFFLYSEEFEWCYRIRKAGFTLKMYSDIHVIHLEEASSKDKDWNLKQRYLSILLLFKKTKGVSGCILLILLNLINLIVNSVLMWKLDATYRTNFLKGQKYFWSLYRYQLFILLGTFKKPLQLTKKS